ncbi:2-C-methyl-D-erythritol 2,4-cyclodiphosphate synthase [Peptoniphilus sp. oral taxon 375 str. F0436]|uniref:2-C-methyl-D-erythritol 2,4-cyclodiphosphate synthase n=1 Tax=Urinicoccus timonensis TaxID=2024205 RepID=UPI00021A2750|nr:2-C-methyl-D-erythritol 2,4-cyclodiphosphate synthase [Urinicoccus timonensis]EGS29593.1 2-C-methyl-D-erythritol 2,4-cyclodiphosphate synthase [Peptoniphilus sp. oral taxon 375 str. F0436]
MRIGFGLDVHAFSQQRDLILGGIKIPYERGLLGHSDADVLVHSIMDALLGAMALGDIGQHFPDTDPCYKDISSLVLLDRVIILLEKEKYQIENIDCVISAQEPKLAPYIPKMKEVLSKHLKISTSQISIKATTTENLGFEGRKEGITSRCVCLLENKE